MISDEVARKKWKYLRDQFSVELGKITVPRSGDAEGESYEPKWPHFKSLLFLKDVVKPRPSSGNFTATRTASPYEANTNVAANNNKDVDDSFNQKETSQQDSFAVDEHGTEERTSVQHGAHELNVGTEENGNREDITPQKRRRIQSNSKYNETIIDMEKKKVQVLEEVLRNRKSETEDMLFFRSLLPHVSKIPDYMKLRFRNRIQEVVEQFAYNSGFSNFQTPSSVPTTAQISSAYNSSTFSTSTSEQSVSSPPNMDTYQNYGYFTSESSNILQVSNNSPTTQ